MTKAGGANMQGLPYPDRVWPPRRGKARVLIESSNAGLAWALESILTDARYDVAACWGPACGEAEAQCPLIEDGHCSLVSGADVVVQSFPVQEHDSFPILQAIRTHEPDKPVCVEVAGPSRSKYGDALDGCTVLDQPITKQRLVAAIDHLVS